MEKLNLKMVLLTPDQRAKKNYFRGLNEGLRVAQHYKKKYLKLLKKIEAIGKIAWEED